MRRRRWLQFSLRSLLAMLLMCCCAMPWVVAGIHRWQAEQARRQAREEARRKAEQSWKLARSVGAEMHAGCGWVHGGNYVRLRGPQVDDARLAQLQSLVQIDGIDLSNSRITDAGIKRISQLSQLQILDINDTQITDEGLASLVGLRRLRGLRMNDTRITDYGLNFLAQIKSLESLEIIGTNVTEDAVARLQRALPHCEIEYLSGWLGTWVTDADLAKIACLTTSSEVFLNDAQMTDSGLFTLVGCGQLKTLHVRNQFSEEALRQFLHARPDVKLDTATSAQ